MRVVVTTEARYVRTPDGRVWTGHPPDYRSWTRYLAAFDRVRVVARVHDQPAATAGALPVDGDRVEVLAVPHYIGPRQYLRQRYRIGRLLAAAATADDAVILKVPSALGSLLAAHRRQQGLPVALEVVADPYDVFAPGVVQHPLRPLLRQRFAQRLRSECRTAVAAAYVTERYLQTRYPPRAEVPAVAATSVDLPAVAFVPSPRRAEAMPGREPVVVAVGTLDQLYKGIDTLIEAVARLAAAGVPVRVHHIGTGRYRTYLEQFAERHGVADRVRFLGWCPPGEELRRRLDAADLFVMPSRTEGLPRALIEAMARGLPAVGTSVGGIPELLPPEQLVPPADPVALALAIRDTVTDPARMAHASAANLARARHYRREAMDRRWESFYQDVRDATSRHLAHRAAGTNPTRHA